MNYDPTTDCSLVSLIKHGMRHAHPEEGGTLIFLYIRKLGSFCWAQKFEFQFFGGFSER